MNLTMASEQAAQTGATAPAARIVNGVKVYGAGVTAVRALDGVSADFGAGQFTAVMGPSGSGKSTALHCLAGLDRLTAGQVLLGDVDLGMLDDKGMTLLRRERIGFVVQAFNLIPTLTARENILLPLTLGGKKPARGWLRELARTLGIADRPGHRPAELSGGQQQRVATARALVTRPDLIFADEPTGNLDSRSATELLNQIRRAVDEYRQTVVMVTHDARAAAYADRVLFLADGRLVSDMRSPTADRVLDTIRELTEPRDGEGLAHRPNRSRGPFQEAGHVARHVGGVIAHRLRYALTALAVLLGVAFIAARGVTTLVLPAGQLFANGRVRRAGRHRGRDRPQPPRRPPRHPPRRHHRVMPRHDPPPPPVTGESPRGAAPPGTTG
jgi:putative ABC transport system ATP-binding protein